MATTPARILSAWHNRSWGPNARHLVTLDVDVPIHDAITPIEGATAWGPSATLCIDNDACDLYRLKPKTEAPVPAFLIDSDASHNDESAANEARRFAVGLVAAADGTIYRKVGSY